MRKKTSISHNRKLLFCAILSLFITLPACRTTSPQAKPASPSAKDTARTEEIRLGDMMLNAVRNDHADDFLACLPEETRKRFTEKDFKRTRAELAESMGKIKSVRYLTELNAPGFRSHLWKVTFERKKTLNNEQPLLQETLFRIVMVPRDDARSFLLTFGFL